MKCEKCNEREANFFYTSNINGNVTKRSLCSQCAAEEGLADSGEDMFRSFFSPFESRSPFGMLDSFFSDDFFAPFGRVALPTLERSAAQEQAAPQKESSNIPDDAGGELKAMREMVELKSKLQKAVAAEDYESAIKLRDEIRAKEKKN